jgi:hypothetical protein
LRVEFSAPYFAPGTTVVMTKALAARFQKIDDLNTKGHVIVTVADTYSAGIAAQLFDVAEVKHVADGSCTSSLRIMLLVRASRTRPRYLTVSGGLAVMPPRFDSQRMVLSLLGLLVMLSLAWPRPSGRHAPRPAPPIPSRRPRGQEPQPCAGLTPPPFGGRIFHISLYCKAF